MTAHRGAPLGARLLRLWRRVRYGTLRVEVVQRGGEDDGAVADAALHVGDSLTVSDVTGPFLRIARHTTGLRVEVMMDSHPERRQHPLPDDYTRAAAELFGVPVEKVTDEMRTQTKRILYARRYRQ